MSSGEGNSASEIAVVVPTFQRAAWLRETLDGLVRQTLGTDRFEVIVTDDGSADGTVDVVRSFADRLDLRYVYHHDLGHRVAATRNAGARAATAPVLAFVDAGTRPSAGCIEAHLDAHKAAELTESPTVVVGRVAGYETRTTAAGRVSAEEIGDMRDEELDRFSRTLENTCLPWRLAWTANLSVDAKVFASVGGFDERFTGWGAEDMELAYRLHRFGARLHWSDEACAVECPHPRDMPSNIVSNRRNQQLFYEMHPEPEVEVFIAARRTGQDVHDSIAEYRAWTAAAGPRTAAESSDTVPLQAKKALFGPSVPGAAEVVINPFGDQEIGRQAVKVHSAVGLHTRLPDKCFESAIVQADHYGPLWNRWAAEIVREARRIASDVTVGAA
jgi:validoxylamine A glucosyltransferase